MHFSFVASPHGLPRKQSPGISNFPGPRTHTAHGSLNCSENRFSKSNLCISKPTSLSPSASFAAPFGLPVFYFYKYSQDPGWSDTGETQAAAQMQLTVSPVNLTAVEAPEHLHVSGSVATPKLAASSFLLERSRIPGPDPITR